MYKYFFGALLCVLIQYSFSAFYTYEFYNTFRYLCGVKQGYRGANPNRFKCVDEKMGEFDEISAVILMRPVYGYKDKEYKFHWRH